LPDKQRRFAVGAEFTGDQGTHFRIWAPACHRVSIVERDARSQQAGSAYPLESERAGYFSGLIHRLTTGHCYSLKLDDDDFLYPDPVSRFQPFGPHGASQIVDPGTYEWQVNDFAGALPCGQVLYEMHFGTFTKEGTYLAAISELAELARLGVTTLEIMPVAEYAGEFGWGYDGVDLWAPSHLYGTPDDLRAFVDAAHRYGVAVILDLVCNHLGPDGNYLERFSPDYFTDRYPNDWGKSINFDDDASGPVREFYVENARYWIEEYRFDGLRLDATQSIIDSSERHVISEIIAGARAIASAQNRRLFIVAENEPQDPAQVRSVEQDGYGGDALWNDDFHHSARVALTGRREAYYNDYLGSPQELISALKWGYLYQGQFYSWQAKCRGQSALDVTALQFVTYLQNHDQVANSLRGDRLSRLTTGSALRALTTVWLLAPPTPMLFQGQEFGASSPFCYFADHRGDLGHSVRSGRREFMTQFQAIASDAAAEELDAPGLRSTFERCRLDFSERATNAGLYELHQVLLKLRKSDPAFRTQRAELMHGACLSPRALLLRFFCEEGDRLVILNLGDDLDLWVMSEPLLAPPRGCRWHLVLSSEDVRFGGNGYRQPRFEEKLILTAQTAYVFAGEPE
jgi:maltooligosyltrehalose trehalohydrolase